MKRLIFIGITAFILFAFAVVVQSATKKKYQPTERIPADVSVSFPVDI